MGFRINRGIFQYKDGENFRNTFKIAEDGSMVEVDVDGNPTTAFMKVGDKATDADKLDGIDSGAFLRSNTNDSVTGHTEWQDNYNIRLGNDADFRMYFDGSHTVFRSFNHANGNIYFQGEDTAGANHALLYMFTANTRPYVSLYEDGGERFKTTSGGVEVLGDAFINQGRIHIKRGTGLTHTEWEDDSSANGRAQLILDSHYSDLIIASRNANSNKHGSTLTFATQSTSTNDVAKWVIGQGQYQEGAHIMAFAYGTNQTNPHSILGTDNAYAEMLITNGAGVWSRNGFSGDLSGNADTAITARDLGANYTADDWFRATGDNNHIKFYGNSRQMMWRTDGVTEAYSGLGGYPFVWNYNGSNSGNRIMLLATDGRLWTSRYGWLDTAFDSAGSADAVESTLTPQIATAQTTANNAATAASNAQSTANSAVSTANDADANATGAKTLAGQAMTLAESKLGATAKAADSNLLDGLDSTAYMRDNGWNSNPGQNADTQPGMSSDFTYSNNAPHTGDLIRFGASGYSLQLNSTYNSSAGRLSFRARNGDNSTWNIWREIWHTGNFDPASKLGATAKAADSEAVDGIDSSRIVYGANARRSERYDGVGMVSTNQNSGFYYGYNPDGNPFNEWWNWLTVAGAGWTSGNNYDFKLAHNFHGDDFYVSRMTNGTQYGWRRVIDSGNIGSQTVANAGYATTAGSADQIDGWGFVNTGSNTPVNADSISSNGISYYNGGVTNFSGNATDGALYSQIYSSSWQHQIAGDYRSGQIALRGRNSGTWQSWRKVWDSGNFDPDSKLGATAKAADSNLLDGIDSGSFVRTNADTTLTQTIVVDQRGTTNGAISYRNDGGVYVPRPQGGNYATTSSSHTGAIAIKLPTASWGDSDMLSFWVDIFDYAGGAEGESLSMYIYGYQYSSLNWVNNGAVILSDRTDRDYTVRFGHDGSRPIVWIGETTSTWNYLQINVRDFQAGYSADDWNRYDADWDVAVNVTSFGTVTDVSSGNYPVSKYAFNADKLDGKNSTDFALASHTHSDYATQTYANNAASTVENNLSPRIETAETTATNAATAASNAQSTADTALSDAGKAATAAANAQSTADSKLGATAKAADANKLDGYDWMQSGKNIRGTEFYADNWFRNYNASEGMYNENTGQHWYSDASNAWNMRSSQGSALINLRTNGTTRRGAIYATDANQIGFLDSDGQWAVKVVRDSHVELRDNNETVFTAGQGGHSSNYGTVCTHGDGRGGWEGYSINGRFVWMSSDSSMSGMYNDTDNEWMTQYHRNGAVKLYNNGGLRFETQSGGAKVHGTMTATSFSGDGSALTNLPTPPAIPVTISQGGASQSVTITSIDFDLDRRRVGYTFSNGQTEYVPIQ